MTTVGLIGELTYDVEQMMRDRDRTNKVTIEKISNECENVTVDSINWNALNRDNWITCIDKEEETWYHFPIAESENRDNNFKRVKDGVKYFTSMGWVTYMIQ